jgi:hypothetical protein
MPVPCRYSRPTVSGWPLTANVKHAHAIRVQDRESRVSPHGAATPGCVRLRTLMSCRPFCRPFSRFDQRPGHGMDITNTVKRNNCAHALFYVRAVLQRTIALCWRSGAMLRVRGDVSSCATPVASITSPGLPGRISGWAWQDRVSPFARLLAASVRHGDFGKRWYYLFFGG